MAKTTINIEILKPDDTPEEGYIYFALAESAALDDVEYSRTPIRVNLDASGLASIQLQPNDDAGWSVSGNSYLVEERFSGKAPRRFYMVVPTSGSALDYADLATYGNAPSITANIDLAAEFAAFEAAANATYARVASPATETPATAKSAADSGRGMSVIPRVPGVFSVCDVESPYELSGQHTHPDVVYVAGGWNGYKYWMVTTPYWHANATLENPSVYASDDGIYWVVPAGGSNPVDVWPGVNKSNSDPDMVLVGSTMFLFYREQSSSPLWEKIHVRSSTDGVSWSAETTIFDNSGAAPATRTKVLSPTVVKEASQYVMWTSADGVAIERRTCSTATGTYSAATTCTLTGYDMGTLGCSHLDVFQSDAGEYFMLLQDNASAAVGQTSDSARGIWLGRSDDGITWTFDASPILTSDLWGQRVIYRTCGLHETRSGKDYFRLWASGASLNLTGTVTENWYIGYSEGFDPNEVGQPLSSAYFAGNLTARGSLAAEDIGASRLFSRVVQGVLGVFEQLRSWTVRTNYALIDQGSDDASTQAPWADELGYVTSKMMPLTIASDPNRTYAGGSRAGFNLHQRSSDISGIEAVDYWTVRVTQTGTLEIKFYDNSAVTATGMTITTAGVMAAAKMNPSNALYGPRADFGASADGNNTTDNPLRVFGDNLRIVTTRTPSSGTDNSLYTGCIFWDANYLYIKTGTSTVKRVALTSF